MDFLFRASGSLCMSGKTFLKLCILLLLKGTFSHIKQEPSENNDVNRQLKRKRKEP
jgi:hypothetical protein